MATMAAATAAAAGQPHFAVGCSTVTLPADSQAGIAYAGGGRVRLSLTDFTGDILFHPATGGGGGSPGGVLLRRLAATRLGADREGALPDRSETK